MATNSTRKADLKNWIEAANDPLCSYSIQHLPYGVFNFTKNLKQIGVAIGDHVLDLNMIKKAGLLPTPKPAFNKQSLNIFMAMGPKIWSKTHKIISHELSNDTSDFRVFSNVLIPLKDINLLMPFIISDYTYFYASREHATNVGTMFRSADNALLPNWLNMPIGYNGRASTVVISGTDVKRARGQIKLPGLDTPVFQPSKKLDIELEMGAVVGTCSDMGSSINIDQAQEMIFGYVLLNDWSARDIQVWEYQPLGSFL
jgi:fumarylacetoacetase